MEFRVLGNLEVVRDGHPVELGAFRQRALLALLLTAPNSVFSTDAILDHLWGAEGGIDKQNALWVYVSGLRKALEPDRAKRTDGTILLTRAPGYLLEIDADQLDALCFERMVAEGRALADADPATASLVLGEALARWRGRAFEDFTYEAFAQNEIARLEGLRLEAVELRLEADLARGLGRELVSELESLVRQHPLNERFAGQLMLALYRSGRQADALRAYGLIRSRLGEELGIEPSPWLRTLESQIVTGDDALGAGSPLPPAPGPVVQGPAVRGYELREQLDSDAEGTAFRAYQPAVGREVMIRVVPAGVANDPTFIRRFHNEAQMVATLEHPHIVPLYDFWREPDAAYLVTRYMHGGTLASALSTGSLSPLQSMAIVDQIGEALEAAHLFGVVHGDVNADNILLDDHGNAYLSEFRIALPDGELTPADDIHDLGLLAAEALAVIPIDGRSELASGLPSGVSDVISHAIGRDTNGRYDNVGDFLADMHRVLGGELGASPVMASDTDQPLTNPYKGLRAFDAIDAADFFGRERLIERLVARLGVTGMRGRFIAVVGPSGSGKSSAVRGGLLPAIRRGALPSSGSWFTVEMTPAPHPFEQLEEALLGIAVDAPPSLLDQLSGERGIERVLTRVLPDDGSQVLLLIDQFEELFTQVDPATAERFIANVVSAVDNAHSRVRILVTLRADFYDRPLQHRALGELLREGTEIITPMTPHELERAIAQPALQRGVSFESAVVAALLRDVADRPGALPLLQYTLTELFDNRRDGWITYGTYEQLGGISSALVRRADGLLSSLGDGADEVARQVFLRLITLTEGGEDTRRRVLRSELEELHIDRRLLRSVLETFGRHRLLSFDRDPITRNPTVEISHEALLTEWTRLRAWIDEARGDVRAHRRLAEVYREWLGADRADAYLLSGGLLDQLESWAESSSLRLSGSERAFLDASVAQRDRESEEIQRREDRAAVAERRQKRRGRQLAVVGLVTVVVGALALFGTLQWRSAVDAKRDVDDLLTVNRLVTASRAQLDKDPELALRLAMQSLEQTVDLGYATEEAVDALHFALQNLGVQYDVRDGTVVAARPGSDGPFGVFAVPPHTLMELAESTQPRALTDDECQRFMASACPADIDVPDGLQLRNGMSAYAPSAERPLEGTSVTILLGGMDLDRALSQELLAFTEKTGIRIDLTPTELKSAASFDPVEPDRLPDVLVFPHLIPDWASGRAIDLAKIIDPEVLRSDFGGYLLSFGSFGKFGDPPTGDDPIRAVPLRIDPKGLVMYPKAAFEGAGYEVPHSWDELIALSDQIVADGRTPWCFGFEAGEGTGWPGTDLIESLVMRVGGADVYDAWTRGQVAFQSPAVVHAGRLADELISAPGYARNGATAISNESWDSQLNHMLSRDRVTGQTEPQCWLLHQAGFLLYFIPAADRIGIDVDFFPLPPTDPAQPTPMVGTAQFMAALTDRPEVREFMKFVASPAWGAADMASDPTSNYVSANQRFDMANYGDAASDPAAAVRRRLAEDTREAVRSDSFRMDASDYMPPDIGGLNADGRPGPFWRGMADWVDGTRTIEEVFADIDAEWAALRAQAESPPPDP